MKRDIRGILESNNNDALVIVVHGLTGFVTKHQFYNFGPVCKQRNFDFFAISLYSAQRPLDSLSIKDHGKDISETIQHFKNTYRRIFLVAHSLGGPSVCCTDLKNVEGIVLWDPALGKCLANDVIYIKEANLYFLNWQVKSIISEDMATEFNYLSPSQYEKINIPTKIILAGGAFLKKDWKKHESAFEKKENFVFETINKSNHCFDGYTSELYEKTLSWFEK